MTGKQQAVMWLGLTLILTRLFTTNQWKDIWATILKGNSGSSGVKIPGTNIPLLGLPLISNPTAKAKPKTSSGTISI